MCGRYVLNLSAADLALFNVAGPPPKPRYNIAPSQLASVIGFNPKTQRNGLAEMTWGLVPHFFLITTEANERVGKVHDRMPVILRPDQFDVWLDPDLPAESAVHILKPSPGDHMQMHPVSQTINRPAADSEDLITAVPLNIQ